MKTIILYRVVQGWRAPVFEKLNKTPNIDIEVLYGPDFKNTKLKSTQKEFSFKKTKLFSFKIRLKSINGLILMPFSPFLFFLLIYKNPKVIISEGASNLANSIIGFLYCKVFGKKFIWWSLGKLQGRKYDNKRKIVDKFIQYMERKSDAIITYSSIGEDYFKSFGIDESRIFKAVNVVDTEKILNNTSERREILNFRSKNYPKYEFITLFVGALIKEKSIELLIKAQALLEKKFSNAGLIIVGDGTHRRSLEILAEKLNVRNIDFVGSRIDDNYKFFSVSDIFVLPGLGGLAISEAMCYELPVIASIGDGCEVDLVTEDNGIIDVKLTPIKLANYIEGFILDPGKKVSYGKKSLEIIKNHYNISNYVKIIENAVRT